MIMIEEYSKILAEDLQLLGLFEWRWGRVQTHLNRLFDTRTFSQQERVLYYNWAKERTMEYTIKGIKW